MRSRLRRIEITRQLIQKLADKNDLENQKDHQKYESLRFLIKELTYQRRHPLHILIKITDWKTTRKAK